MVRLLASSWRGIACSRVRRPLHLLHLLSGRGRIVSWLRRRWLIVRELQCIDSLVPAHRMHAHLHQALTSRTQTNLASRRGSLTMRRHTQLLIMSPVTAFTLAHLTS